MARRAPGGVELERTVTHRLHLLQKLTDRASQAAYLDQAGLPLSEGRCLSAVGSFSPLSVKDLAARANLDKAQASRAAQSLVDQGLVLKQPSEVDGRVVVLTLTADGQAAWRRVMKVVRDRNAEIVDCLSSEERQGLGALLDRMIAHARAGASGD